MSPGGQSPEEVQASVGSVQAVLLVVDQAAAQLGLWITVALEQDLLPEVLVLQGRRQTHVHTYTYTYTHAKKRSKNFEI